MGKRNVKRAEIVSETKNGGKERDDQAHGNYLKMFLEKGGKQIGAMY